MKRHPDSNCPCGNEKPYAACCKPLHDGAVATNAEALMRSRYTAYVLRLESYLLATWHASTRPSHLNLADEPLPKWLGLQIKQHKQIEPNSATVEFIARHQTGGGRAVRLHEISRFACENGQWFYVDGEFPATQ